MIVCLSTHESASKGMCVQSEDCEVQILRLLLKGDVMIFFFCRCNPPSFSILSILNKYLSLEYHFSNHFHINQDKCQLQK